MTKDQEARHKLFLYLLSLCDSHGEFSRTTGIDPSSISHWKKAAPYSAGKGKIRLPSWEKLEEIAGALGFGIEINVNLKVL